RYPIKDRVAIVGLGSTGFARDAGARSELSLAAEAAVAAVGDAGLGAADIDGVCGTSIPAHQMVAALGLPNVTWYGNASLPVGFGIVDAMSAIHAGVCEAVLVYHSMFRTPFWSRSAANDPFRRNTGLALRMGGRQDPETVGGAVGYAAWASRYIAEYTVSKEAFGRVAVNDRTNAGLNPLAVRRDPITMDDYLSARMVREPLCLLDMDIPVDGGDAFILTTAERAADLPHRPVLLHAACAGIVERPDEDQIPGLRHHGQHVVVEFLRSRSDLWIDDVDLYFPYDGFTIITLCWIENSGWCGPGEAGDFLAQHWDEDGGRVLINGRVPVNTHGGALSEGGTQGSGHVREAVLQLRGEAGERQVPWAESALVTPGGFFFNSQGMVLRVP
ncbi:MAG: thiolase C-terminal domain-containing protein, partial [Acidimicrobiales bacterium]